MKRLIVLLACAAVLACACGDSARQRSAQSTPKSSPAGASHQATRELTDIRQLQAAFDAHPGVPRLLILLSPT
jgi:hypothetical protein